MDGATFVIRFIEALAWPGAAVTIAFVFRKELRSLMPLIRKLKAGPLEAEFEREVQAIAEDVADEDEPIFDPRDQMLVDLVKVSPRAAILEAWLNVESATRRAVMHRGGSPPPDVSSPVQSIRMLVDNDDISSQDLAIFHELRGLRNQAAHVPGFDPSPRAAMKYVYMASQLRSRLEELADIIEPNKKPILR
jgi:hypothetical protein